jgi:hypothetical protein
MIFNPVIVGAIVVQSFIAKASGIAGAITGYVITTGIMLWGLSLYSDGYQIAFFGIPLSQSAFIIACLIWYGFDTKAFIAAKKIPSQSSDSPRTTTPLDEKWIEQISKTYNSKSTTELQDFIETANQSEYSPETFEAIRRLIELRKDNSLKKIRANLKDGEEVEKKYQEEKEKELQDHLKNNLEEIEEESYLLKKSIKSVALKRKIVFVIGILFFFLTSLIAIYAKDFGTFVSYLFVYLLFFGAPFYYLSNKHKKHNVKLLELERETANLSQKIRQT